MKVLIKNARLAFPNLFKAEQIMGEGDPKFGATFLIPKGSPMVAQIEAAIKQVATEKWGAKAEANLKALQAGGKTCLRDGDSKADYAGFADHMFISANTPTRPVVVGTDRAPLVAEDGKPYAGCYVNATVDIWAQDNGFGKRINAKLLGVQFYRDGDAFSGGAVSTADDFEDLSAEDELADLV